MAIFTLRKLAEIILELKERVQDLEAEHGEVAGFHFSTSFPANAYPNQIVVRTDETPPEGGTMYRYDNSTGQWLAL